MIRSFWFQTTKNGPSWRPRKARNTHRRRPWCFGSFFNQWKSVYRRELYWNRNFCKYKKFLVCTKRFFVSAENHRRGDFCVENTLATENCWLSKGILRFWLENFVSHFRKKVVGGIFWCFAIWPSPESGYEIIFFTEGEWVYSKVEKSLGKKAVIVGLFSVGALLLLKRTTIVVTFFSFVR